MWKLGRTTPRCGVVLPSFQVWTWYPTRYWVIAIFSYVRCVTLWAWPIFPKIGSRNRELITKFIHLRIFEIWGHKMQIPWQPALPWQPFCAALVGNQCPCYSPSINVIGPSNTELFPFLCEYVTWRCDLDLDIWPFDLCHVTWYHLGGQSLYQVWGGYDLPFQR